jgi:DNA gyrase subunit B
LKKESSYGNHSIKSLKGADRVRLRPGVIFGSDGLEGCQHSIFEILSNSIDEARQGYGNKIEIYRYIDNSIKIIDYGRGIPLGYNENEKKENWELVFCELYAGGKYENNNNGGYSYSLGLNGLGLCSTQYSSEYMDVSVASGGMLYTLHFEKGINIGGLKVEISPSPKPGTTIKWRPDREVFTDTAVPLSYYQEVLKRQAIVNANLLFCLYDEESGETYEYLYKNGINDYIEEVSGGSSFTPPVFFKNETAGRDRSDKEEYKLKYEISFCFNNEINLLEYYHNSSYLEHGGSPDKAVKSAFVSSIDTYLKQKGLYKKGEKKIAFTDIEDSLILIINSFSTVTSYENQTKKSINNKFIQESITDFLKKNLEVYFIENKADADKIANQILVNKHSRETAENTRINIRKKLTGSLDFTNRVEKFVNCRSKDVSVRELYLVEGDSALGACKLARDASFQAIMPMRGKILNCLKADYGKIFNSTIITDLIKVLGCGVEIKNKHVKDLHSFDLESLRWDKIIICTDADVDGFQIRTLVLTMLYRLVPTLINERKVFIAESPLYEITSARKTYFAYNEQEKIQTLKKITGKYDIQRSKGLGQNEPDMMWQTTMNPETRRLILVEPEDVIHTQNIFDTLLGDNLKGRKEFIEEFGHLYIDLTEIV